MSLVKKNCSSNLLSTLETKHVSLLMQGRALLLLHFCLLGSADLYACLSVYHTYLCFITDFKLPTRHCKLYFQVEWPDLATHCYRLSSYLCVSLPTENLTISTHWLCSYILVLSSLRLKQFKHLVSFNHFISGDAIIDLPLLLVLFIMAEFFVLFYQFLL